MGLCLIQAGLAGWGGGGDSTWVDQAGHRVVFLRRAWVSHVYPRCLCKGPSVLGRRLEWTWPWPLGPGFRDGLWCQQEGGEGTEARNDGRGQAICGNGGGCFLETLCGVYVSMSHVGMISDDEFHSSHKPSQRWDRNRLYISLLLNSVSLSKDRQHWRVWIPVLFNWDQRVPDKSPAVKCPKNDQRRHDATSHSFLIFWFVF